MAHRQNEQPTNQSAFVAACLSNRNRAVPLYSWKTVAYATAQAVLCGLSLMQVGCPPSTEHTRFATSGYS